MSEAKNSPVRSGTGFTAISAMPYAEHVSSMKAKIDWMDFAVTLPSPSQFRHVQARMLPVWAKTFIEPEGGNASSRTFKFRLQNPPPPEQFMREIQSMRLADDPLIAEADVQVMGIEVALDLTVPGNDRWLLARVVLELIRHQKFPPAGPPRIIGRGTATCAGSREATLHAILNDPITIICGERDGDRYCRFYLKDYDSIGGNPYQTLPQGQWRARFENTLRGTQLPFHTIQGWRECRFEKLMAEHFALVKPIAQSTQLGAALLDRSLQLGRRPDTYRRPSTARRQRRASVRCDSAMNDKIRQAMRALTRAQQRGNSVRNSEARQAQAQRQPEASMKSPEYCITLANGEFNL